MHPYETLPPAHFWNRSVAGRPLPEVDYDPAPKFTFRLAEDRFATAGSCFAQHFGRNLEARGGHLAMAEKRHPLIPATAEHGYGLFSARYGNIYNTSQFRELIEQAVGARAPIMEFVQRPDQRWVDALRPRAVPDGFSSALEAERDRLYHLGRVRHLLETSTVFVFTLGLTEGWRNKYRDYTYGICPGVIAGSFDFGLHEFRNLSLGECVRDLGAAFELMRGVNPSLKVLLTVSPVMLVATAENRGVLQSSVASKSILRAAADECVRTFPFVDYFPSFEIIAGPQARGRFFDDSLRDVKEEGIQLVMDTFFKTRMPDAGSQPAAPPPAAEEPDFEARAAEVAKALQAECDEIMLDSGNR